jgi:hypothetical protein
MLVQLNHCQYLQKLELFLFPCERGMLLNNLKRGVNLTTLSAEYAKFRN